MAVLERPYTTLKETLRDLKTQVYDSMPYIGDYIPDTIKSPSELFYFLRGLVTYQKDPKGVELLQTVQTLMDRGGKGDCDCFTILVLTACEYLGFGPQQVALVGKSSTTPSHIYSLVFDPNKNTFCAMDLTNPYYCMERNYPYKQTLNFSMRVRLEDNGFPLLAKSAKKKAKQAAKAERKQIKQQAKTAKKVARTNKKVARVENKMARKTSRQERRTDRTTQKQERKALKRATKVQKKENKLIRATGKGEIIRQRQAGRLERVKANQEQAINNIRYGSMSPDFEPEESDAIPESYYDSPGTSFQPVDYDTYPEVVDAEWQEVDEEEEPEYYEEYESDDQFNDLSLPFIPAIIGGIRKVGQKIKGATQGRAGQAVQRGVSKYNELASLKRENEFLKSEVEREKRNKLIFGGGGTAIGMLTGFLLSKTLK